jgi:hypothetical protein
VPLLKTLQILRFQNGVFASSASPALAFKSF